MFEVPAASGEIGIEPKIAEASPKLSEILSKTLAIVISSVYPVYLLEFAIIS